MEYFTKSVQVPPSLFCLPSIRFRPAWLIWWEVIAFRHSNYFTIVGPLLVCPYIVMFIGRQWEDYIHWYHQFKNFSEELVLLFLAYDTRKAFSCFPVIYISIYLAIKYDPFIILMYVCTYICRYVCIYLCAYVGIYIYICIYIWNTYFIHVNLSLPHVRMFVSMYAYIDVRMWEYIYIYIYFL